MVSLSVIIVSFNSAKFIADCLNSVLSQFNKSFEMQIIVVDNASTDKTLSIVKNKFPRVNIIRNMKNLGFAKANNRGISLATGKYVLFLNPDTVVGRGSFQYLLSYLEANPQTAVATCRLELPNGSLDDASHRGFPTPWNAFCHFLGLGKIWPQSLFFNGYHLGYRQMETIHEIDSCVGAFMLVKRKIGDKLNWLDEDYFWYGEDLDFCYRVKEAGFKIVYIPEVKTIHYKGVSSGLKRHSRDLSSADDKIRYLATKSRFEVMRTFYRKHYLKRYPFFITMLTLKFIDIFEWFKLRQFKNI